MITAPHTKTMQYRWLIFALLAVSYVMVYFHRTCPAVLAVDIMRDLQSGGALTGLLSAAYFYPYALMQLPAGLLADSWGPRKTITLFFTVAFLGCVILGYAPTVFWAIVGRAMVGIGAAMLFVPAMKILAEWFRISEFAYMTGILMAMGGVGSLSAAVPLVWLSSSIGWRHSFVVVGFLTLILAVLVWIFVRNRPVDLGWPPPSDTPRKSEPAIGLVQGVKQVLVHGPFWILALWFFCNCGLFFALAGLWGGPYLQHVYGLSKISSGKILSMPALGMVVGSPFLSFLSDRIFKGRKRVLVLCTCAVVGVAGLLAFRTDRLSTWELYAVFFMLGFFSSAVVVIGFTMNKELFPLPIAGTATGLINLFPFIGGALFQPLLGHILEKYEKIGDAFAPAGYRAAFFTLFVSAVIAAFAAAMTTETLKTQKICSKR